MKILYLSLRAIVESVSMDQQVKYINGDGLEGMPEMAVGKELRWDNSRTQSSLRRKANWEEGLLRIYI